MTTGGTTSTPSIEADPFPQRMDPDVYERGTNSHPTIVAIADRMVSWRLIQVSDLGPSDADHSIAASIISRRYMGKPSWDRDLQDFVEPGFVKDKVLGISVEGVDLEAWRMTGKLWDRARWENVMWDQLVHEGFNPRGLSDADRSKAFATMSQILRSRRIIRNNSEKITESVGFLTRVCAKDADAVEEV